MLIGTAMTGFVGVFGFNVGNALSPVVSHEQKLAVVSAQAPAPPKATPVVTPQTAAKPSSPATVVPPPSAVTRSTIWSLKELYVSPTSGAAAQSVAWATARPADATVMARMAAQSQAEWFGDWNVNVQTDVSTYVGRAAAAGKMPVVVAYNIPNRDCGSYSAGGAGSAATYTAWMQSLARGIAGRPAVVILEPDALPQLASCLSAAGQQERVQLLQAAVTTLKAASGTYVYLDAGNPGFQPATVMAPRLTQANIAGADGFSLNVSNFYTTPDLIAYGTSLSALVGNKHFVLDTSRNGNGPAPGNPWCNPDGRALGAAPTTSANLGPLVDALLWIKRPGESDGTCNGGPSAGDWWADYALSLARKAGW